MYKQTLKLARKEIELWYDGDKDPAHIEQSIYFYALCVKQLESINIELLDALIKWNKSMKNLAKEKYLEGISVEACNVINERYNESRKIIEKQQI